MPTDFITLDDVRHHILQRRKVEQDKALERPTMVICDKYWEPVCQLRGELDWDVEKLANDTGEADITIPGDHLLVTWLLDPNRRKEDVHLRFNTAYWEWTGKCDIIQRVYRAGEMVAVRIHLLHDYHQAKRLICFANPALPAELQVPKAMPWAGPSASGVATYGLTNMWRMQSLNAIPDNIFNPGAWGATFDPSQWWTVMVPINPLTDTSTWALFSARFPYWHDLVAPTLESARLLLDCSRWWPGQPQPAPGFYNLTHPTRVFRVKDMSGYRGPTGTLVDLCSGVGLFAATIGDRFDRVVTVESNVTVICPVAAAPGRRGIS